MKLKSRNPYMGSEQEFRAKFTTLFESHPDIIYLQTPDGKIVDCNTAATTMTGYSREELLALGAGDLFQDDVFVCIPDMLKDVCSESQFGLTGVCIKKDGCCFPVSVDLRYFLSDNNPYIFVIVRDISTAKKNEEEIHRLENQLHQSQKMEVLGQLAGGITHYYNNIFTGLIGALDIAQRDANEDILPLLKRAEKVANLASGFTRRLLTFTREPRDVAEPTDIGALIDDVAEFMRVTFDRDITLDVKKPDSLNPVLAEPASLHHVLLNLLVNARDALREKQRTVSWEPKLTITIEADNIRIDESHVQKHPEAHKGSYVRIVVSDTGCGMNSETRKRVFEPFFTTKEAGKGTGLGLATARSTVTRYGGWFELSSEPGKGSTFTFYLPATSLKRTASPLKETGDLPRGTETILLVDDDEIIRSLGKMMLERQGYTVITASNGAECMKLYTMNRKEIDLIILDLLLPVLSGQEVLKNIRRIDPGVSVVILTGHDFERESDSFAELRADDYLLKPFTVADLVTAVRNVLDRKPWSKEK